MTPQGGDGAGCSGPDVHAYFQRVAPEWDHLRQGYYPDEVRDVVLREARLQPEMCVADIGCGTGFLAAALAPKVAWVHCLDASGAMLAEARQRLGQHDNVSYHLVEAGVLPLDDASIDIVVANMVLHHTADPAAALQEWTRPLRPGGRLVLTDMDAHDEAWTRSEMADVWPGFQRADVASWLRGAGLEAVRVSSSGET